MTPEERDAIESGTYGDYLRQENARLKEMISWMGNYDPALVDAAWERFRPDNR
jgi:hypothetical protein